MYSSRLTGLGAAEQPEDLKQKIAQIETWIGQGLDLYQRLGRYAEITYGNELKAKLENVKRQFFKWGVDDIPELKQYIPLFWANVGNWYSKAEELARQKVLPMITEPAPIASGVPGSDVFKQLQAQVSSLGVGSWVLPIGAGLLLFLLMRR